MRWDQPQSLKAENVEIQELGKPESRQPATLSAAGNLA